MSTGIREAIGADELAGLIEQAAEVATDEVVTRALSRDIALPHQPERTAVLITLTNGLDHTRPNTLGPRSLGELSAAIDAALAREEVAALMITGKQFILAAGADLSGVPKITELEQAKAIARIGHAVFDKLHTAQVPTFAFVNGLALGGGLEVGLHCDYRTVSAAAAGIGLPECFLGMFPGWGGAYLLPNLIGADKAVTVIIENALNQNTMLSGKAAYDLGIADAIFDGADFLERSIDWAGQVVAGTITVERAEIDRGEAWDAAVARGRKIADAKTSGAAPGPYQALELIAAAKTSDRAAAYAAEDDALAALLMSPQLRAGLYAFDLVQKRAKRPAGAPDRNLARAVSSVGVVGAGLMASQLALLFARRLRVPVIISDLDQERVERGLAYVRSEIDKLLAKKRISPDAANRLRGLVTGTVDLSAYAGCDFVIEAVFEELSIKQDVLANLEKHVSPECVLATNTSSLSVSEMAEGLDHPERVVGFHFFNPVAVLPLIEVIRGKQTDDPTLATALFVAKELRKNAVLVEGRTGLRGEPAADPADGRGDQGRRRGHPDRGGRHRAPSARPADDPVRAAPAGRSGGRAARRGNAARGVRRPLPGVSEPRGARGGEEARDLRPDPGGSSVRLRRDPRSVHRRGLAEHPRTGAEPGHQRAGGGDRADARRGRGRRADGHRPLPDPRCRLAVPQRRHHPVPGSRRHLRARRRPPLPAQGRRRTRVAPTTPRGRGQSFVSWAWPISARLSPVPRRAFRWL